MLKNKDLFYDVIIVGAGPAGISAAIYLTRAGLTVAIIEAEAPGGKMIKTQAIENYPGFTKIDGPDLALKFYNHLLKTPTKYIQAKVLNITKKEDLFFVETKDKKYESSFVIVATGMSEIKPDLESFHRLNNKGISYCAICDGALYKDQEVAVIGGGNSAVEESFFLTTIASKVHLILRRDQFRADKISVERLLTHKNVEVHYNFLPHQALGQDQVSGLVIKNTKSGDLKTLKNIKAIFPYIGYQPATSFLKNLNVLAANDFVKVDSKLMTSIDNLYAVGDVVNKNFHQIITASSDGATAAREIIVKVTN